MAKFIFQAGVFFKRPLYPANTSTIVTVYDAETGSIVPVWNDRAGADPRANPGAIWQEGQIKIYLNAGRYNIVASNGSDSKTWNDVIIVDPDAGGGGGGGASSFLQLTDTPSNYTGQAGKVVVVNGSANGLAFVDGAADTVTTLSISSGNVAVDLAGGANSLFALTLTSNVTGWTFNNKPGSGKGGSIWIEVTQAATPYTVSVPTPTKHTGGTMPTGSGNKAALAMTSLDNWTTAWSTFGVEE